MHSFSKSTSRIFIILSNFFKIKSLAGAFLFFSALLAMILANSPYAHTYHHVFEQALGISFGELQFSMELRHWVNDGLMAIFFLLVGLEIKREFIVGELSNVKRAMLPLCAALGGMVMPLVFYLLFNSGENAKGFAIPMATDIAFAIGILMLLKDKVPFALKIFLTSLAVIDDLGAVLIIAVYYTNELHTNYLLYAFLTTLMLLFCNKIGVKRLAIYIGLGALLWYFVYKSGVHATIAGIVLAITIPIKSKINPKKFLKNIDNKLSYFRAFDMKRRNHLLTTKQREALEGVALSYESVQSPLVRLEHIILPFSSYFIMPIFAFANAGITLEGEKNFLESSVSLGIIAGLVLGKPIGIYFSSLLAIKCGIANLPKNTTLMHVFAVSLLGGIGFTMSIFIANLAFEYTEILSHAKLAVIVSSLFMGVLGASILFFLGKKRTRRTSHTFYQHE